MSFLADPPLLVGTGIAIEATVPNRRIARLLEAGVLTVFLGTSISLYLNLPWTRRFWELFRAKSGRDFMWNSGVLRLDYDNPSAGTHAMAAALFATYPLWLRLGRKLGSRLALRLSA